MEEERVSLCEYVRNVLATVTSAGRTVKTS